MLNEQHQHHVGNRQQQYGSLYPQLLPTTYIDRYSLLDKLGQRFGANNFKIQLRLNKWTVFTPQQLSDQEVKELCYP